MHRLSRAILASVLLTGCGTTNVLFSDTERIPHPHQDVVTVIYDRYGDIYPSDRVHVPGRALRLDRRGSEHEFTLKAYFRDQHREKTAVWRSLIAETPLRSPGADTSFALAWADVQSQLRERAVDRINYLTQDQGGGERRTLVVLVHGFNNDHSEALEWYDELRSVVRSRVRNAVFLDVYWDGLSATVPPGIWKNAQYNFPLVGLEFRRVLNAIDPGVPLRVITHSSGGPLMASTMGDASAPLTANDAAYQRYRTLVATPGREYMPPNPADYRVGMIVPAASSITFEKFGRADDGPDRLVIGINPQDIAISKLFFPCTYAGSTCMSGSRSSFCAHVVPVFASNPHTKLYVFDFSHSGNNERQGFFWDAHAVSAYLRRDDMSGFLDLLFEDEVSGQGEQAAICKGA